MPRPAKLGLDYFPLDTTILNDIKIRRLKRQFGADAFLLYISLLCDIYSEGYYIEATDDYLFDQGEKLDIPENKVLEIILSCVKIDLFSERFFIENRILTSKSIQERFSLATKKRSVNQIIEYKCDFDSASVTPVSATEITEKQGVSTQSKVKERKVNLQQQQRECEESTNEPDDWNKERETWKDELLSDEDWQATIVRYSGKGLAVLQSAREAMAVFDDFLRLKFSLDTIRTKKDYSQSFIGWWRYHSFNLNTEELSGGVSKNVPKMVCLSRQPERKSKVEELMETGRRATEIAMEIYNSSAV